MTRILVVDDDSDIRELLSDLLEDRGYEVIQADGGSEGLEKAAQDQPDLIILDVMMPEVDGFAVIKSLKENPETEKIPVVILTGLPAEEGEHVAMKAGIDHYIPKPWTTEALELSLRVALRDSQRTQ